MLSLLKEMHSRDPLVPFNLQHEVLSTRWVWTQAAETEAENQWSIFLSSRSQSDWQLEQTEVGVA